MHCHVVHKDRMTRTQRPSFTACTGTMLNRLLGIVVLIYALASAAGQDVMDVVRKESDLFGEEPEVVEPEVVELMELGEGGNPVAANPPPRDFYKIPNMRMASAMLSCEGVDALKVPTGNLNACARVCQKCPLCKAFVHTDFNNGECLFKTAKPIDECLPGACETNADSYMKCPKSTWSDGTTTDDRCSQSPRGFAKWIGQCACATGGADLACNSGQVLLVPENDNLQECATMCKSCAIGADKCVGFVRERPVGQNATACRFKSVINPTEGVNEFEDLYGICPPGYWSDGTFSECKLAPLNYAPTFNTDGGNDISCEGSTFHNHGDKGDLNDCAKICDKCSAGTAVCIGFIRREDQTCNFKGDKPAFGQAMTKFGSIESKTRDMYTKCPLGKVNDGTQDRCMYPDDWQTRAETGSGDQCTCLGRPVGDLRYSSATYTFNVFSDRLPMFLSSKPQIHAPCQDEDDDSCSGKTDGSLRTSGAGAVPTKVRITASSNDAWCMARFCISSESLGKRWVYDKPTFLNPGAPDNGRCLPASANVPNNNWGWCRYIAPGITSNMTNCNSYHTFENSFWEVDLTEEDGDCFPEPTTLDIAPDPISTE